MSLAILDVKYGECRLCGTPTEKREKQYPSEPHRVTIIEACPKCSYRRFLGFRPLRRSE